jgi:hypothetical protein
MAMLQLKDDSMHKELKRLAEEQGVTLSDLVENIVFDYLFNKGQGEKISDHFVKADDYETMARSMIAKFLPTHMRQFSTEMCDIVLKIPAWQHLLAMYRLAYDQGQWSSPYVDPAWAEFAMKYQSAVQKSICGKGTLKGCGCEFEPLRIGQIFCTNKCAATLKNPQVTSDPQVTA